jgi:hypothetical protein
MQNTPDYTGIPQEKMLEVLKWQVNSLTKENEDLKEEIFRLRAKYEAHYRDYDTKKQIFYRIIADSMPMGITRTDLLRKVQWSSYEERKKIITDLFYENKIQIFENGNVKLYKAIL